MWIRCYTSLSFGIDILVHVHVLIVIVVVIVVLVVDCVDDWHGEEGGGDEEAKEGEDDECSTVSRVVTIPGNKIEITACLKSWT